MALHPDFAAELRQRFTGEIRLDRPSRILYSTDASIYQMEPLGVVFPQHQEDLHAAVELAAKYEIPILPRGSGTSLAGQAIGHALILDCSRWLDSILELNPDMQTATVEPGVILSKLNAAAARHGLMFGPDPASAERATMGGVIGNNATGAHSLSYGMTADHLLSADVIASDGSLGSLGTRSTLANPLISSFHSAAQAVRESSQELIRTHWPRTWRNSAGYRLNYLLPWSPSVPSRWTGEAYPANLKPGDLNLAPLLAGSEGTLAVIRRATVRLVPRPPYTILAVLAYQSNADACDDVPRLLTHRPSAVELIPRMIVRLARRVPAYARQMGWVLGDPAALLVVEFSGDDPLALRSSARRIGDVIAIAETGEDQARVWNIRRVGLGLLDSQPQSERPVAFVEDCAIPVQRLGAFTREVEKILAAHGTEAGIYAHASAGCLHIRPILDLKTVHGTAALRSISQAVLTLTLELGGAMSSEHGDGLARSEFLEQTYGREIMDAMRLLKRAADPKNILNPGKIIDAPRMDLNLRYGEGYRPHLWQTGLSFAASGGLDVAIEQCNGQGVCRKDSGVMCPSYQATREEMHSTRGRANLLRALISGNGAQPESGNSPAIHEMNEAVAAALDLCLACKGCKAECPSGVDMAKLKYAFEARYYETHTRPGRDYLFGYFHHAARLAALLAPLTNAALGVPVFRNAVARSLGVTSRRPFPRFSKLRSRLAPQTTDSARRIIFLSDPFTRYIEPEAEQAALDLLAACGLRVSVLPIVGAGASLLSKAFLGPARAHAARLLDLLRELDPSGEVPVVGIEPPEIYTLKDDFIDLLPEHAAEIRQRTASVWLLDEFLLRSPEFQGVRVANKLRQTGTEPPLVSQKLLFLPHCHQRAQGPSPDGLPNATAATVDVLHACGYDVELLDTGCCGMAGTFGYEAEHYDLSMQIAELKLFPRLRAVPADGVQAIVAASGSACRMQIEQGTGATALHPALLAAKKVVEWRTDGPR